MMKLNQDEFTSENFKEKSFEFFTECFDLIQNKNFNKAQRVSTKIIIEYIRILRDPSWGDLDKKNLILILAIGIKAIDDYAQLGKLTSKKDWFLDTKKIEAVWIALWDCKDRTEYVIDNFKGGMFWFILKKLNALLREFYTNFGNGIYASPEFIIKSQTCSICRKNVKACDHISGRIYGGQICKYIANDIQLRSISLVTVPKDPRCRAWPWRLRGRVIRGMAFLFKSDIDSFLAEKKYYTLISSTSGLNVKSIKANEV